MEIKKRLLIYCFIGIIVLFYTNACGTPKTVVVQPVEPKINNNQNDSNETEKPVTNFQPNHQLDITINQNDSNTVNKPDNVITTIAKEGYYNCNKGIIITIPKVWDKKVIINEDSTFIKLCYTGIPNKKLEIFTIACFSHEKYNKLLSNEPNLKESKIGENQSYVFCLYTPLAIDLTVNEEQTYSKEIDDFNYPIKQYIEMLKIIE